MLNPNFPACPAGRPACPAGSQFPKQKIFCHWAFRYCLLFGIWCLLFGIYADCFAQDLSEAEALYLKDDYKEAIKVLEKALAEEVDKESRAEVYYLLGLSYLKSGNFLKAGDCFDIIIREYRGSKLVQNALIKLIDLDLVRGDYNKVGARCEDFLSGYPKSNLISAILLRQFIANLKLGNWQEAQEILSKIEESYPESPALKSILAKIEVRDYFSVQVGSFRKKGNAERLVRQLSKKDYDAFIIERKIDEERPFYRVRVGKVETRSQAEELEKRLIQEGYPTRIYP